jgi:hypothetical protein
LTAKVIEAALTPKSLLSAEKGSSSADVFASKDVKENEAEKLKLLPIEAPLKGLETVDPLSFEAPSNGLETLKLVTIKASPNGAETLELFSMEAPPAEMNLAELLVFQNLSKITTRSQCYKTFLVRDLWIFVLS